jgi:hypothetical protein
MCTDISEEIAASSITINNSIISLTYCFKKSEVNAASEHTR